MIIIVVLLDFFGGDGVVESALISQFCSIFHILNYMSWVQKDFLKEDSRTFTGFVPKMSTCRISHIPNCMR